MLDWLSAAWTCWDSAWCWPVAWKLATTYAVPYVAARGLPGLVRDKARLARWLLVGLCAAPAALAAWRRRPSQAAINAALLQRLTDIEATLTAPRQGRHG